MTESIRSGAGARHRVAAASDVVVVGGGPAGQAAAAGRRTQRRQRDAAGALQPPRRPRLRRHGAGARRHVGQPPGNLGARHLPGDDRAHGRRGLAVYAAEGRAPLRAGAPHGRAGAPSTSTARKSRTRSASPPPSIRTASSAPRSRWSPRPRSTCACTRWFSPRARRGRPDQGRDLRDQERPRGHPGQGRDRRHRRPRRRRLGRRAAHRGRLHLTTVFRLGGVDTDAAERFEHEEPRGLQGDRPRGQAPDRRRLGQLVAEDAAARRGLVQLPAHGGA